MAFPPAGFPSTGPSPGAPALDYPPPSPSPMGGSSSGFSMRGIAGPGPAGPGGGGIPTQGMPPEVLTGITQSAQAMSDLLDSWAQVTPDQGPQLALIKDMVAQYLATLMGSGAGPASPTAPGSAFPGGGMDRGISLAPAPSEETPMTIHKSEKPDPHDEPPTVVTKPAGKTVTPRIEEPEAPPPPLIRTLNPASAAVGDPSFSLRVAGSGFTQDSVIVFAGHDEPTTFLAEGEVTTVMNMAVWLGPDPAIPCLVRNGTVESNTVTFDLAPPRAVPLDPAYSSKPSPVIHQI